MINPRTLVQLTNKWQRTTALGRRRLTTTTKDADSCSTSSVATEGHCIIYSVDRKRFKIPLAYLGTTVFSQLLRMSQEEFGFTSEGRITLPCDAVVMEYVMCLLRKKPSEEVVPCNYASCMSLLSNGTWPATSYLQLVKISRGLDFA